MGTNHLQRAASLATFCALVVTSLPAFGDEIPGGGTILFEEPFDDANLTSRAWYDGASGAISNSQSAPGSPASFECRFTAGAGRCIDGIPARHKFPETESLYLSFYIKFGSNWIGSGRPYHPHIFNFFTNEDSDYVGPSDTHLTTYAEVVDGTPVLSLQDSLNVDEGCLLRFDGSFIGCNGDFDSYPFTEERSVAGCNGLDGEMDLMNCYDTGSGWYSSREWHGDFRSLGNGPAPYDKTSWHFIEVYMELNSIDDGIGVPDGKIRWVQDGETLISSDQILFRTGEHPNMMFNQLGLFPYIGDGSPRDQTFWIDEMTLATASPLPVPEPAALLQQAAGIAMLFALRGRRRSRRKGARSRLSPRSAVNAR